MSAMHVTVSAYVFVYVSVCLPVCLACCQFAPDAKGTC